MHSATLPTMSSNPDAATGDAPTPDGGAAAISPRGVDRTPSYLYYAKAWGDPVGRGASASRFVEIDGYAKKAAAATPFVVVNEFVASRLGSAAGLPIPPGCLLVGDGPGEAAWVTLSYLPERRFLPDADPGEVVAALPEIAAGVVVFDFIIANTDRNASNLALTRGPVLTSDGVQDRQRLEVFDHSHAVLYGTQSPIAQHLNARKDEFSIGNNCLLVHITSAKDLAAWAERLRRLLADEIIREICAEAVMITGTLTDDDATALGNFLIHRRDSAGNALRAHAAQFRNVPADAWNTR